MSTNTNVVEAKPMRSVLVDMASRFGMEERAFEATLRGTVVPANTTREEFAAFLLVAKEYDLNPITKEIYAFPKKGGGIQPIVSIDGWLNIINSHPNFDGMEFVDNFDPATGKLSSITCKMYRKDRGRPVEVTEYMGECTRNTDVWKQWPARMLRHKATIQAARYAFGFSGIMEPDEAERAGFNDVTAQGSHTVVRQNAQPGQSGRLAAIVSQHTQPEQSQTTPADDGDVHFEQYEDAGRE